MQPQVMAAFGSLFALVYLGAIAAVIIYTLKLVARFVSAQERVATAMEAIARRSSQDGK